MQDAHAPHLVQMRSLSVAARAVSFCGGVPMESSMS